MALNTFLTLDKPANKYNGLLLDLVTADELTAQLGSVNSDITTSLANYYTKTEADNKFATILQLDDYVETTYLTSNYYDKTSIDSALGTINSKLSSVYTFKGSVADYAALPSSGNSNGDVWNTQETNMNYAWIAATSTWDPLGSPLSNIDLSGYATIAQLDLKANIIDVYTKTVTDATFIKGITANGSTNGVSYNWTTGVVDINVAGVIDGTVGLLVDRITAAEEDIDDLETAMATKISTAKFNTGQVTVSGTELIFDTLVVDSTSTAMTLATLNSQYATKVIGFQVYCTHPDMLTKYVKVAAAIWVAEPLFMVS